MHARAGKERGTMTEAITATLQDRHELYEDFSEVRFF
jgi:hypothetical protein